MKIVNMIEMIIANNGADVLCPYRWRIQFPGMKEDIHGKIIDPPSLLAIPVRK